MCTLLAWRTEACIAVTSAVDVGPACAALGALLDGALLDGGLLDGALLVGTLLIGALLVGELLDGALVPHPAITTAAQPPTLAISTLAGTPMAS